MPLPSLENLGINKIELADNAKRVKCYTPARMAFIMVRSIRLKISGGDINFLAQDLCSDEDFLRRAEIPIYYKYLFGLIETTTWDYLLLHN